MDKKVKMKDIPVLFGLEPMDIQKEGIAFNGYYMSKIGEYINKHLPDVIKEAFLGKHIFVFEDDEDILWKISCLKDNKDGHERLHFVGLFNDERAEQDKIWVVET